MTLAPCTLDVDGDSFSAPLTDGLLAVRYLFQFTGESLVGGALSPAATRTDPAEIADYLAACEATMLDADGDGEALALTDGMLILRRLFGFTGAPLIEGALGAECTRCSAAAVEEHLAPFLVPGP